MIAIKELLAQARVLGEAIAAHERVKAFLAARQAVQDDAGAQQLLRDYQAHVEHIRGLERQRKAVEVPDKRRLAELESGMAAQRALQQLLRAQADYIELMNQVNRAIEEPLAATGPTAPPQ